jgi:ubiquinone/menaquinone biosynthesis C-methylase UbiE
MSQLINAHDAAAFKSAIRTQWDSCAPGWDENIEKIGQWLRGPTDAMLAMAGIKQGDRVLDVAAGSGDQTLDILQRVGEGGSVLATDLSAGILQLARLNIARAGYGNVAFREADGEALNLEPAHFDAAVSRLGLMLFPDPQAGLQQMRRALKPGGRACAMVFGSPEANPCVGLTMATALKHAGLPPRDPFSPGGLLSLGKPGLLDQLFGNAGFSRVATTKVFAPFILPAVEDYVDFLKASAGPILQILGRLNDAARAAAWSEIRERLSVFSTPNGWAGPNELLLTVGEV